jgi:hypothetical protein
MKLAMLIALVGMFSLPCTGQHELGSTSPTSSIPTGSDRSPEIRAQGSPIVRLYANQLKKLALGSVDFLNKLDVYQKAYSRAPRAAGTVSSLEIGTPSSTSSMPEPMILKAAQELLIAYGVSEQGNIKVDQIIKERAKSPGLWQAVAKTMETAKPGNQTTSRGSKQQTLNMEALPPDVKDSALNSILSACSNLGFACRKTE